jgi:hypothetical protein
MLVCPSCFEPMLVPDADVALLPRIATARAIAIPPLRDVEKASPSGATAVDPVTEVGAKGREETPVSAFTPHGGRSEAEWVEEGSFETVPDDGEQELAAGSRGLRHIGMGALVAAAGLIAVIVLVATRPELRGGRDEGMTARADLPAARPAEAGPIAIRGPETSDADNARRAPRPVPEANRPPARPAPASKPAPTRIPTPAEGPIPKPAQAAGPPAPALAMASPLASPQSKVEVPSPPEPTRGIVVRRRQAWDQEAIRKQLAALPELGLNDRTERILLGQLTRTRVPQALHRPYPQRRTFVGPFGVPFPVPAPREPQGFLGPGVSLTAHSTLDLIRQMQPELAPLPWRMGQDCHLGKEPAEDLQVYSRTLRDLLQETMPNGDIRPDPERLRPILLGDDAGTFEGIRPDVDPGRGPQPQPRWVDPAAIPALMQLLMAERTPTRLLLVEVLAMIRGQASVAALSRLALFDLAPEVRDRAILALRDRAAEDYRPLLLEGFRYPWPTVADHAAEALVALRDRGAVPALIGLLDAPDPQAPMTVSLHGKPTTVVRSLAQVNHLKNCLLCHAPSTSPTTDLVRGRVPVPGQPLPPPRQYYGDQMPGTYVRAEVTYLRQDFSVAQPVESSAPWPSYQRYDYLISELPATTRARERAREPGTRTTYGQRESVLFALRELTGKDLGTASEAWRDASDWEQ